MIESKPVNLLFKDLYDLQRHGVMVDTRLVLDDGELAIHWPILELYGNNWWSVLGKAGNDNVVILPGVSLSEAQQFIDVLYGKQNILSNSNKQLRVMEDTEVQRRKKVKKSNFVAVYIIPTHLCLPGLEICLGGSEQSLPT